MPTGSVTVNGTVQGLLSGAKTLGPITISAVNAVALTEDVALTTGNNTVAIPAGSTGMVIIPQTGNTQTLTLKGVGADTGVALSKFNPTLIPFDTSSPANFVLSAGGNTIVEILFF